MRLALGLGGRAERVGTAPTRRVAFGAAVAVVAVALALGANRSPLLALVAVVGVVGVLLAARNSLVALCVLASGFFFRNYLDKGSGLATPIKAIGALAVAAWLFEWALDRRRFVSARPLVGIVAFGVWIVVSFAQATDEQAAVTVVVQYALFFVLSFLVLQVLGGDDRRARILTGVVVAASSVAAAVGLVAFLKDGVRAVGPLGDPNDFAFVLASSVPLALYQARWASSALGRRLSAVSIVVILATILATYSRSGLVALLAAGIWALTTRRLRLKALVPIGFAVALVVIIGLAARPQVIEHVFAEKSAVAQQNVYDRFYLWHVALEEFAAAPITGVGPGNYPARFQQFAPTIGTAGFVYTTHNSYLNVLAEFGAPGTALFFVYLGLCWAELRKRFPDDPRADALQGALAAGFVAALTGAFFLTEERFPPFWLLPAIASSQALRLRPGFGSTREPPVPAPSSAGSGAAGQG